MGKPLLLDLKEKATLKTLYENLGDITGEILLNESVENFDYIEVILTVDDNRKTIKINNPHEKTFWEEMGYSLENDYAKVFSKFKIVGNKITPIFANCGYYTISYLNSEINMNLDRNNYIRIYKVIGGKYYEENQQNS